jgi:FkbM family methyltransferase
MWTARRLGFTFVGTTYTELPPQMRLFKRSIALSYPDDRTLIGDVINIFLDDEYGLGAVHPPIKTVLDIGANIGLFSLWARHNFPDARIHAYEPNQQALTYALANLKEANVTLFSEGVSDEDATCELIMSESYRGVRTEKIPQGKIKLAGIGAAIERIGGELDLLKMDCEGGEWDIFLNRAAFQTVRQIRMEYHFGRDHNMEKLEEAADNLRFRITKIISHDDFGIAWLENCNTIH